MFETKMQSLLTRLGFAPLCVLQGRSSFTCAFSTEEDATNALTTLEATGEYWRLYNVQQDEETQEWLFAVSVYDHAARMDREDSYRNRMMGNC